MNMDSLSEKIAPIAAKMQANRYLSAIKEGFFGSTPLLIAGSIFLLFTSLPIDAYTNFLAEHETLYNFFYIPYAMTFNIMTIYVICGMARSLAGYYKVDTKMAICLSLAAFLLLQPLYSTDDYGRVLQITNFGAQGLFVGMIAAVVSVEIYRFCIQKNLTIKMPDSVPPAVTTAFAAVIPALFVILVFDGVRTLFALTSFGTFKDFIFTILQQPLQSLGGSLPATLLCLFLEALIWCFGIHGSSIVSSVMNPIWYALSAENLDAAAAGLAMPNIVNYNFIAFFVKVGGCGATLSLALMCLFKAKSERYKALGKLGIGSSIFNINEPILFGFPIVLNPTMMIPFIIANVSVGLVTYLAIWSGLVPYISGISLPYTIPAVISGFMLCGWRGALLQVVEIVMTWFIYYPFFRVCDKEALEEEAKQAAENQNELSAEKA